MLPEAWSYHYKTVSHRKFQSRSVARTVHISK